MRFAVALFLLVAAVAALPRCCPGEGGSGGGGGPMLRYYHLDGSRLDGDFGGGFLLFGGRGYGAVSGWLRVGGASASSVGVLGASDDDDVTQRLAVGGLVLEPYLVLAEGLSLSAPVLVGGGSYEFRSITARGADGLITARLYEDGFFALETGAELLWRPLGWFGLGLGGGYLWIFDGAQRFTGCGFVGLMFFFGLG